MVLDLFNFILGIKLALLIKLSNERVTPGAITPPK